MKADLHLIDNGKFWTSFNIRKKEIINIAKEARLLEGKKDNEGAYEKWYQTSDLIDQFECEFLESPKIQWAKKQYFFRFTKEVLIALLIGIAGSLIVQYLFPGLFKFLIK